MYMFIIIATNGLKLTNDENNKSIVIRKWIIQLKCPEYVSKLSILSINEYNGPICIQPEVE